MFNWKFLSAYKGLYDQMNDQIQVDFQVNPYEMEISDQTFYANKLMPEYERIKKQIPEKDIVEFFNHGSRLKVHPRMSDENNGTKKANDGVFGKGTYATDNPFYAAIFANGGKILGVDEKAQIICCRAIYNKTKVINMKDDSDAGKPIENDKKK